MSPRTLELEVLRYRPDVEQEAVLESYTVECESETTLLDLLLRLQESADPSLAFRWSCRTGLCGACGVSVNGRPALACITRLPEHGGSLRLEPLATFPVIRDLVVELEGFLDDLCSIGPGLPPDGELEEGGLEPGAWSECLACGLCDAACPIMGEGRGFIGPAALVHAWSRERTRPEPIPERERRLAGPRGVWVCHEDDSCTRVCPEGIDVLGAILGLKLARSRGRGEVGDDRREDVE